MGEKEPPGALGTRGAPFSRCFARPAACAQGAASEHASSAGGAPEPCFAAGGGGEGVPRVWKEPRGKSERGEERQRGKKGRANAVVGRGCPTAASVAALFPAIHCGGYPIKRFLQPSLVHFGYFPA